MLAILKIRSEIESRKCFAIKTTIFHYKVTIFTNRTSLTMNNFTMTSVLKSNMRHSFINYINAIYEQFTFYELDKNTQAHREGGVGGVSYPESRDVCGAPPSLRNIKYTRMHHFQKKTSKIFSLEGPRESVSPGPAVALDGLENTTCTETTCTSEIYR